MCEYFVIGAMTPPPTCRTCLTDRCRRQVRSLQPVLFRNTRLSSSARSRDALRTDEPLMSTAAWNRPFASGDVIRVQTEVPPSAEQRRVRTQSNGSPRDSFVSYNVELWSVLFSVWRARVRFGSCALHSGKNSSIRTTNESLFLIRFYLFTLNKVCG